MEIGVDANEHNDDDDYGNNENGLCCALKLSRTTIPPKNAGNPKKKQPKPERGRGEGNHKV